MNVLIARFNYGSGHPDVRVCDVRETKTIFIEDDNSDIIKYKKVTGKEYAAATNDTWSKEYLYHLDSDFAIKTLGGKVLTYDHPNQDYIRNKLNEFSVITEAEEKLSEIMENLSYEKAVQILEILK